MSQNKKPAPLSEEETLKELRRQSDEQHKRIVERQDEEQEKE